MSETTYSFGAWLRGKRKERNLTQKELAERAYCSLTMIKKIETDQRRPSRQLAESLAHALGSRPWLLLVKDKRSGRSPLSWMRWRS